MGTKLAIVVVYDISDNGLRRRVEKICKAYGLSHVQRSAFVGFLEESERRALYSKLSGIIELEDYPGEASIRIFRMPIAEYKKRFIIGRLKGFDDDPEPEEVDVI